MKSLAALLLFFAVVSGEICRAQNVTQNAKDVYREGIKLIDEGHFSDGIQKYIEAKKLDPSNYIYDYEMAYAYYAQRDYKNALDAIRRAMAFDKLTDQCYQMEGNIYDDMGDTSMALKAYGDGLKKFPNSGKLYLETGNYYLQKSRFDQAMPYYEKGIKVEPSFPSNYYRAAILYLSSDNAVWGMLYGEIFMNLERNSKRTADMSRRLYSAYRTRIVKASDSIKVDFSTNVIELTDDDLKNPNFLKKALLPFGGNYEQLTMLNCLSIKNDSISYSEICKLRSGFIAMYYKEKHEKNWPNILFDYEKNMQDAGYLNAYNHWLLSYANRESFDAWHDEHKEEYEKFLTWFADHPLQVNKEHMFIRTQY